MTDEQRIESIWKHHEHEMTYWLREHFGPLEAKNVSIHEIERGGGAFSTIIFDMDEKSAVLIQTDTTAMTPKDSHEYMMIEPIILAKLASLINPKP
jgi:hypothetical protein